MTGVRRLVLGAGLSATLLTDVATVGRLVAPPPGTIAPASPLALLAVHTACTLGAGALLANAAPSFVRHTPREVVAFTVCISFFIPVLGLLGVLAILTCGLTAARLPGLDPWHTHDDAAELDARARRGARSRRRGPSTEEVSSALRDRAPESAANRFRAVLATRHLPARVAVPLLRIAQSDPSDEVRLYAFSRLETMRDEIEKRIERLGAALDTAAPSDAPRLRLWLAESYWELGWSGLAEGAVLEHALTCAHDHAAVACELLPNNAAAEFFLGKVLARLGDTPRANVAFERAIAAGYPRGKALPHLAECAFDRRDFGAVRALLSELGASPHESAALRSVIDLWVGSEPAREPRHRTPPMVSERTS